MSVCLDLPHKAKAFWPSLSLHFRLHWLAWALALALLGVIQANYRLCLNLTPSLPQKVFLIKLGDQVEKGGYAAYRWHGGGPYPAGFTFVKRVLAVPGDTVVRHGRDYTIGETTLIGKERGMTGRILYPNDELVEGQNTLPPQRYFVAGDHEYSLDSRYSLGGLVKDDEVIGRAFPLF